MGMVCASSVCSMCPACPCCEFSVNTVVHQHIKDIMKNWMERLTQVAPNCRIRDLKMMTSHDCGTYSIPVTKIGSSISRTQAVDVYEQLDLGVRQIDFRYGPTGDRAMDIAVRHGPHSGGNYFKELIKVKYWLEDNPFEFLIIDAKCEKRVSSTQRSYLMKYFSDKFGKYLITKKDCSNWFNVKAVTLDDIRKRHPKRVLLLVDDMILQGGPEKEENLEQQGFLNKKDFLMSKWHNTGSVQKLFGKILEEIEEIPQVENQFVNLQLILSPKIHLKAITKYCLCLDRTRIDQKQRQLFEHRKVQYFVRDMASKAVNFVMMDFVNYDPHITNFLVGLNFPFKLSILKGYVVCPKGIVVDVTEKLKTLVSNNNSLWIVWFGRDLGIHFAKADLHIIYEYEAGRSAHKEVTLHRDDQYLLNVISHLDVTLEPKDTSDHMMEEFNHRRVTILREPEDDLAISCAHSPPRRSASTSDPEKLRSDTSLSMCLPLVEKFEFKETSFEEGS